MSHPDKEERADGIVRLTAFKNIIKTETNLRTRRGSKAKEKSCLCCHLSTESLFSRDLPNIFYYSKLCYLLLPIRFSKSTSQYILFTLTWSHIFVLNASVVNESFRNIKQQFIKEQIRRSVNILTEVSF